MAAEPDQAEGVRELRMAVAQILEKLERLGLRPVRTQSAVSQVCRQQI